MSENEIETRRLRRQKLGHDIIDCCNVETQAGMNVYEILSTLTRVITATIEASAASREAAMEVLIRIHIEMMGQLIHHYAREDDATRH